MVTNQVENIHELIKDVYSYFDGLVFVDGLSSDGTRELLEKYKKDGQILIAQWVNAHGWSMQGILNSEKILYGDWVIYSDDKERIAIEFAQNIRSFIVGLETQGINTVYLYGKILMHKYFSCQTFKQITPHCYLENPQPKLIDLARIPEWTDERKSRYNVRPEKRPKDNWIGHFFRYLLYKGGGPNNQLLCGRENDIEGYKEHEIRRQEFLLYIVRKLGLELNIENIKTYLLNNNLDQFLLDYVNFEPIFNYFYAYYVQKQPLDDIIKYSQEKKLFRII